MTTSMSQVKFIVVGLISVTPIILLFDGLLVRGDGFLMQGIVAGVIAIATAISAFALRPGEATFLVSTLGPLLILMLVPALWMAFQVVPTGILAHPFWESAEHALGRSFLGTISIDPGASVIALGGYLSLIALVVVSAAVAIERQRAKWMLLSLVVAGTIIAFFMVVHDLFITHLVLSDALRAQTAVCAAIGGVVSCAACTRALERYESVHWTAERSISVALRSIAPSVAALVICIFALALDRTSGAIFACGCGLGAIAWVWIARRVRLGPISAAITVVVVLAVAVIFAISRPVARNERLPLAFAASVSPVTERILADAPLAGSGAATFASLVPIYREEADATPSDLASTTATNFAIELGQPMLWFIVAAAAGASLMLLRGALRRGRDAFYPAMGMGCLITLVLLIFVNSGLAGMASSIMAATAIGTAFAQNESRMKKF
jgi:hypothetical protein